MANAIGGPLGGDVAPKMAVNKAGGRMPKVGGGVERGYLKRGRGSEPKPRTASVSKSVGVGGYRPPKGRSSGNQGL